MALTYYHDVISAIRKVGFVKLPNGKGSHECWCRTSDGLKVVVPRNLYSKHTANGILKDAGLPKQF